VNAGTLGCATAELGSDVRPAWPLKTYLEFGALPTAASCARGHVRAVTSEWGLAHLADTAELLASELVTNAIRASAGLICPVIGLWLASDQISIVMHVWDASDAMPVRQHPGYDDSNGRGLVLVDALSADWGCYRTADGKIVWAQVGQ
jgi:anti-sigma regulatory factor (Ser/Thr protein kinase)